MNFTVSVALCTHNGSRFLAEQLQSILAQSYPPIEIVLSDDDSTDNTIGLARELVDRAESASPGVTPRLRILRNSPARGIVGNFQQAIQACSGDLIALCDQDDVWRPDRLQRLVELFDRAPDLLLLHSDATLVSDDGTNLGVSLFGALEVSSAEKAEIHSGDGFSTLLRRNLVTGATTLVRRSLLPVAFPVPESWIHDEWLGIIAGATGRFDVVDEKLLDYRQHSGNQIGARKSSLRDKVRKLREPRAERNTHLLQRATDLVAHLERLGPAVAPGTLERAKEKLEHERFRFALPASRPRRLLPVLKESSSGRYRDFSRGNADAVRDLLQPA